MRLINNSLWNLLGGIVPALAAVVTVPVVVRHLGEAQYGLLTLVTSIVGYFALLDINASQGSVKYLAEYKSRGDERRMREVFCFGIGLYALIGSVGAAGLLMFAGPLARGVFNVPAELTDTAVTALRFGGVAFFFGQLQSYLLSVPQALGRYDASARSEAVFGSLASLSTVAIVLFGGGLVEITAARAAIAAANVVLLTRTTREVLPGIGPARPGADVRRAMLSFSAFSYLSRLAAVSYASADKLLIGACVDLKAVAMYSVPSLVVNRLFSLTFRLGQVMLPEASRLAAAGNHAQLRSTYLTSARVLVYLNTAIVCLLVVLGRELLHHWAGKGFGADAALVLALVASAVLVDSFTNLPSLVNDGLGRPANTGVFALVRALVGLAAAWLGVRAGGIVGVACAELAASWLMAAAFLAWVHARVLPARLGEYARHALLPSLVPWTLAVAVALWRHQAQAEPLSLAWTLAAGAAAASALAVYGWVVVVPPALRERALQALRRRGLPGAGRAADRV